MKTILCKIEGPQEGELVTICYRSARGGRTHVMHRMTADDSYDDIAAKLVAQTQGDKGWMREAFEAKAKGSTVIIQCSGLVSDVVFDAEIEAVDGTTRKMAVEEL